MVWAIFVDVETSMVGSTVGGYKSRFFVYINDIRTK